MPQSTSAVPGSVINVLTWRRLRRVMRELLLPLRAVRRRNWAAHGETASDRKTRAMAARDPAGTTLVDTTSCGVRSRVQACRNSVRHFEDYLPALKRFSASCQLTTFHHAPM